MTNEEILQKYKKTLEWLAKGEVQEIAKNTFCDTRMISNPDAMQKVDDIFELTNELYKTEEGKKEVEKIWNTLEKT